MLVARQPCHSPYSTTRSDGALGATTKTGVAVEGVGGGSDRFGASGADRCESSDSDRFQDSGSDRFQASGADRFQASGSDRFRASGSDRCAASGSDRFRASTSDCFQTSGSDRFEPSASGRSRGSVSDRFEARVLAVSRPAVLVGFSSFPAAMPRLGRLGQGLAHGSGAGLFPAVVIALTVRARRGCR